MVWAKCVPIAFEFRQGLFFILTNFQTYFRVIQVLELNFISMFLEKKILIRIMKYQVEFKHLFCLGLLKPAYATFLKGCKSKCHSLRHL